MPLDSREKGRKAEHEASAIWRGHGFTVQPIQRNALGVLDHMILGYGVQLVQEVKRTERAQPWEWLEQAARDAPTDVPYVVTFRRSRSPWHSIMRTAVLAEALRGERWQAERDRADEWATIVRDSLGVSGRWKCS